MDHEQLAERLEKKIDDRFNALEKKIDDAIHTSIVNKNDISWLKSFVKTSVGIYVTLFAGMITSLFKHFIK